MQIRTRDTEGQNPLYLPQAKVYDGSCALGPGILLARDTLPSATEIRIEILRGGRTEFSGTPTLAAMKREQKELVSYLYRECSFPAGCLLMTGTGIVPPDSFTLMGGDEVLIEIDGIGRLRDMVGV